MVPSMNDHSTPEALEPITMKTAPDGACPVCRTPESMRYMVWGMPSREVFDDPRSMVMGCVIGPDPMASFCCAECNSEFDDEGNLMADGDGRFG